LARNVRLETVALDLNATTRYYCSVLPVFKSSVNSR